MLTIFLKFREKITTMARRDELLDKKRQQSFLCAPSYKREIEEMGSKGYKKKFLGQISAIFLL